MVNSVGTSNPYQAMIQQRYNEIYAHERAHKNAAGSYGGSIVIEKDAKGIPIGGHVDILMPVLNKANPDETIKHADVVIKSAMAPSDPSAQDYKVANEARSIRSKALKEKHNSKSSQTGNKLNIMA